MFREIRFGKRMMIMTCFFKERGLFLFGCVLILSAMLWTGNIEATETDNFSPSVSTSSFEVLDLSSIMSESEMAEAAILIERTGYLDAESEEEARQGFEGLSDEELDLVIRYLTPTHVEISIEQTEEISPTAVEISNLAHAEITIVGKVLIATLAILMIATIVFIRKKQYGLSLLVTVLLVGMAFNSPSVIDAESSATCHTNRQVRAITSKSNFIGKVSSYTKDHKWCVDESTFTLAPGHQEIVKWADTHQWLWQQADGWLDEAYDGDWEWSTAHTHFAAKKFAFCVEGGFDPASLSGCQNEHRLSWHTVGYTKDGKFRYKSEKYDSSCYSSPNYAGLPPSC